MRILILLVFLVAAGGIFYFGTSVNTRKPASMADGAQAGDIKEFKRGLIKTLIIEQVSASESSVSIKMSPEICNQYQKFELVLVAEGFAINGDPVLMSVERSCLDLNAETGEMLWSIKASEQSPFIEEPISKWQIKALNIQGPQQTGISVTGYEFIAVLGTVPTIQFQF
jgi:hypothetical protein